MNTSVNFVFVFLGALLAFVAAQKPYQSAAVAKHNQLRSKHQGTESIVYDDNLAKAAEQCAIMYVKGTAEVYSCPNIKDNHYGENWALRGAKSGAPTADDELPKIIQSWYNEIKDYNFGDPSTNDWHRTGHFTQAVWKETKKVGCGCARDTAKNQIQCICAYDPPGNFNTPNSYPIHVGETK